MLTTKMKIPSRFGFKVLDDILYDRYMAVRKSPELKITNRWDLSDTFYKTRKKLDAMGYDVSELKDKRGDYHAHVKDWCDRRVWKIFDENGNHIDSIPLKRHHIGIFAADRAVMAFQGELNSISFENYKDLAHLGVDIVLVEKEGTVEKLVPFTTEFGIAFVQSQGFIAEYGVMLAEEARKQGVNLAILTDFDASGINLAFNINGVIRIGADLKMLEEFNEQKDENGMPFEQLDPLKLMESYNGADHWIWCKNLSEGAIRDKRTHRLFYATTQHDKDYTKFLNTEYEFNNGAIMKYLDFLKDRRIELNTIMNEVQPQRFWYWLKDKLIETFPNRDYNRAMTVPDYVLTDTMEEFYYRLKQKLIRTLSPNTHNIKSAYEQTNGGFLRTFESLKYARKYLKNALQDNDSIKEIDSQLRTILEKL